MSLVTGKILPTELETLLSPSLVIFRDRLVSNIATMLQVAGNPERLRPHCKTHKMERVTQMWIERGVRKHKAATIAECEMLARAGAADILFAYNPVGPNIPRIVQLAMMFPGVRFSCTADHAVPVTDLSAAAADAGIRIGVWMDVNVGMDRTGITPESPEALRLYSLIARLPGLYVAGFHVYDGHRREPSLAERNAAVLAAWPRVIDLKARCENAGIPVPALACGGTPTFPCYAAIPDPAIELCPGTCVFHDAGYGSTFPDLNFQPAAAIVTRVVSRPAANRLTLDLGNKAVAADPPKGARILLPELPDAVQEIHSEEHLGLLTPHADRYQPGDVLLAIPVHVCPTSALYDRVAVIDDGRVREFWEVTSRNRRLSV